MFFFFLVFDISRAYYTKPMRKFGKHGINLTVSLGVTSHPWSVKWRSVKVSTDYNCAMNRSDSLTNLASWTLCCFVYPSKIWSFLTKDGQFIGDWMCWGVYCCLSVFEISLIPLWIVSESPPTFCSKLLSFSNTKK